MSPSPQEGTPLERFLEQFWRDRDAGVSRELHEYLALYPGDPEGISREFAAVAGMREADPPARGTSQFDTPDRIGPYQVIRELGVGGQGVVYLARDTRLDRVVAVKVVSMGRLRSGTALARFRREAAVASRLDHPGLCTVYDAGEDSGQPYIAMRYVEGETLSRRIHAGEGATAAASQSEGATPATLSSAPTTPTPTTRRTVPAAAEIRARVALIEKVARALQVAHDAGVVHRDIKPANIMVMANGEPVLLDFGVARDIDGEASLLTRTGEFFGTPAYMSPEQIAGGEAGAASDVYSLGVTMFESLSGQRPFEAPTHDQLCRMVTSDPPPSLRRSNPAVERDLEIVALTALAKEPERRYRTAAALADDLQAWLHRRPIRARPVTRLQRVSRWIRREPVRAALLATLVLLAAVVGWAIGQLPKLREAEAQRRGADIETLLADGFWDMSQGASGRAESTFRRVLAMDPACVEARVGVAMSLNIGDRRDDAVTFLRTEAPGSDHPACRRLIRRGARSESTPTDSRADAAPTDPLDMFVHGLELMTSAKRGDGRAQSSEGLRWIETAVAASPRSREFFVSEWARAAGLAADAASGRRAADVLRARSERSLRNRFLTAFALEAADPQAAAAEYREFLRRSEPREVEASGVPPPENLPLQRARAWSNLAALEFTAGRVADAMAASRSALALAPDLDAAWHHLGLCLFVSGDPDGAVDAMQRAIALQTTDAGTFATLANMLVQMKRHAQAEPIVRTAVRMNPRIPGALVTLGIVLDKTDRSEEAIDAFRQAVAVDGKDRVAHLRLSSILQRAKRDAEVLAEAERWLVVAPTDPASWLDDGLALRQLGRREEARAAGERGLRLASQPGGMKVTPAVQDALRQLVDDLQQ